MLCNLQFFDNINNNENDQGQPTSEIICSKKELKLACFFPENQAVLQLLG